MSMDKEKPVTVNAGGASEPTADEEAREYEIAGNVKAKGDDPSPDDRERGETSGKDQGAPVDFER
jgi:hypothetical protein